MTDRISPAQGSSMRLSGAEWARRLIEFRTPSTGRGMLEIAITFAGFFGLWSLAYLAFRVNFLLAAPFCIAAALFLVRIFTIQHDCGHGSFFKSKTVNDWVGRVCGVLTLTPYFVWKQAHQRHHTSSGNLDSRGIGAIHTLTVDEFFAMPPMSRMWYRVFRHPLTLFVIGPAYVFFLQNRIPLEFAKNGWRYWASAMGTNVSILAVAWAVSSVIGVGAFLILFFTITTIAAAIGVWLFYVQHQFDGTYWERQQEWKMQDAALYGSSFYDLPQPLRWLTANIGIHHVHHLNSRIPFYRLGKVLKTFPELKSINRLTIVESLRCVNFNLWDERARRLISFREAARLA